MLSDVVKDKLWIWGHDSGSHNDQYGLQASSRMTPAEGAFYLGVPNVIMVRYNDRPKPPFHQYAVALRPLRQVVWSIVGAGGAAASDEIDMAMDLAAQFPNFSGVMMDDFFRYDEASGRIAVHTIEELEAIQSRLKTSDRKLDLWVVLYNHQLEHPVEEHLEVCDVVSFWIWTSENLESLERNFQRVEEIAPSCRKVLGCYMYDYGNGKPMPVDLMKHQCELGLQWLRHGRIEGMIFLASCICDLELETVEWTRQWINEVGGMEL
jgi:hypothetical protein